MKQALLNLLLLCILFSCKKEIPHDLSTPSLLSSIMLQLKDSMANGDFQQLDFTRTVISNLPKENHSILRIALKNKSIETDFILLKVDKSGLFSLGKIITLVKNQEDSMSRNLVRFNGKITMYSLNKNIHSESTITNGYVDAFHPELATVAFKEAVAEVPLLPEVILLAEYPSTGTGGWTYSNWFNYQSFFYQSDVYTGGGGGGYYNSGNPTGAGGNTSNPIEDQPIYIDYEPVDYLPAIDIKKYINCFSSIPDNGATCTIKISADIPVDDDPNAFLNWQNGSPGHVFLQITKTNGIKMVQQNIGFYPIQGWKTTLTPAPIRGKFSDNAGHEFNASLSMNLTPEQLQSTLVKIQYLANFIQYDIDDYNCTDFALEVFNHKRTGSQLEIPMFNIPGGNAPNGTATPQGLYQKLLSMKKHSDPESPNITIPGVKGFVGNSKGPCN